MFLSITYFSDNQGIQHLRVGKFTDPQTVKSLIVNALGDAPVCPPPAIHPEGLSSRNHADSGERFQKSFFLLTVATNSFR